MTRTSNPDFEEGTLNPYQINGEEIRRDDLYGYKVVVVIRVDGPYAYRGPTSWSDDRVAREGDEVPWKSVARLFPTLDRVFTQGSNL